MAKESGGSACGGVVRKPPLPMILIFAADFGLIYLKADLTDKFCFPEGLAPFEAEQNRLGHQGF
jgi:hypothetical protein